MISASQWRPRSCCAVPCRSPAGRSALHASMASHRAVLAGGQGRVVAVQPRRLARASRSHGSGCRSGPPPASSATDRRCGRLGLGAISVSTPVDARRDPVGVELVRDVDRRRSSRPGALAAREPRADPRNASRRSPRTTSRPSTSSIERSSAVRPWTSMLSRDHVAHVNRRLEHRLHTLRGFSGSCHRNRPRGHSCQRSRMTLRELLAEGRTVRLDGGLSTALEELGADIADELWTARVLRDQPELVLAAHRAFVDAGAEIVISASYQAPDELLRRSRADRAAGRRSGRRLGRRRTARCSPAGRSTRATTRSRPGGTNGACGNCWTPDCIAIETQPRVDEAASIVRALEALDGPDAWVTFTCRDGALTGHGEPIEDAVRAVASSDEGRRRGRELHGAGVRRRAAATRAVGDRPPARGLSQRGPLVRRRHEDLERRDVVVHVRGRALVGGCCGWGPAAIARLR